MLAIIAALLLSILHSFSKFISKFVENHHVNIVSFSAGMFITLIFIHFLPRVTLGLEYGSPVFLIIAFGFVMFHLSEKYLYQHVKDKKKLLKELAELHNFGFFIDHLMIGFLLYLTFELASNISYIVLIPFILHTISSSISLEHIHHRIRTKFNKIVLNSSTFLGALFASIVKLDNFWFYSFFAFFLGSLFYVSIRDMLPGGKKGNPFMFFVGFLLTIGIFAILP